MIWDSNKVIIIIIIIKTLKKDGLSVQNIGKPQVALLFAFFFFVYIFVLDKTAGFGSRHFI